MDQQTVTYLLIAALLATALLVALAVVVPRVPRRGGSGMLTASIAAGAPMFAEATAIMDRAALTARP